MSQKFLNRFTEQTGQLNKISEQVAQDSSGDSTGTKFSDSGRTDISGSNADPMASTAIPLQGGGGQWFSGGFRRNKQIRIHAQNAELAGAQYLKWYRQEMIYENTNTGELEYWVREETPKAKKQYFKGTWKRITPRMFGGKKIKLATNDGRRVQPHFLYRQTSCGNC